MVGIFKIEGVVELVVDAMDGKGVGCFGDGNKLEAW